LTSKFIATFDVLCYLIAQVNFLSRYLGTKKVGWTKRISVYWLFQTSVSSMTAMHTAQR